MKEGKELDVGCVISASSVCVINGRSPTSCLISNHSASGQHNGKSKNTAVRRSF
ncbi:MAG: hypothetical protein ACLSA6_09905 [Holdemania massiliensis]